MQIVILSNEMLIHRKQIHPNRSQPVEISVFAMVIVNQEHVKQYRTNH
jgi:hypothetical protein